MPANLIARPLCLALSAASSLTLFCMAGAVVAAEPPAPAATPSAAPAQVAASPQVGLPRGAIEVLNQLPAFQPGLWEFRRTVATTARPMEPDTITKCSDPLNEIRRKMTEMMGKGCRISGMTHNGNRYRSTWSCVVEDGAVAVSNLITADSTTSYQDVNESRYQQKTTHTVVIAKRLGDCSPAAGPTK